MNKSTVMFACLCTSVLAACSSGGPAGDSEANPEAVRIISEFEGLYELPVGWDGSTREAFLEIQAPSETGEANVIVSRQDQSRNCFETDFFPGTASISEFDNRVFLDDIDDIEASVISLVNSTTLRIEPADGDVVLGTVSNLDVQICAPA